MGGLSQWGIVPIVPWAKGAYSGLMQVSSQSSQANEGVSREIYQALILKKAVKAEGDQQSKLIESAEVDTRGESQETVGRYLNERA